MNLTSTAFSDGGAIPAAYTCPSGSDAGISPALAWSDVPPNTRSFALIVDDPDAPDPRAPKMTWVHWVVYNLPADARSLAEGVKSLPAGAIAGDNDWHRKDWGGPCPPVGRHRYYFKLYALDTTLGVRGASKSELEKAMKGHVLGEARLMGTYQKK